MVEVLEIIGFSAMATYFGVRIVYTVALGKIVDRIYKEGANDVGKREKY